MEAPLPLELSFEGEDEDDVVNLQTRRKKINNHSPTSSESSITTESSESSFEKTVTVSVGFGTNGEKQKVTEDGSVVGEAVVDVVANEVNFDELNKQDYNGITVDENCELYSNKDEGTNGFSVLHNGAGVANSFPETESDAGDKEVHIGSNGACFSKSADSGIGLKFVESLVDERSSVIDGTPPVAHTAEQNIVNEVLTGDRNNLGTEVAEFDVEGVLQKQETHDLYCPNCNSCITKRVILRRRKRKIQEISTDAFLKPIPTLPVSVGNLDEIVEPSSNNEIPEVGRGPDAPVDAVTCLSCFSIFIPTGNGFLFWKFGPKPDVIPRPDGTSTVSPQDINRPAEPLSPRGTDCPAGVTLADAPKDEGTGKLLPLWILTCCQPYDKKPEQPGKLDAQSPSKSELPIKPNADTPLSPEPLAVTTPDDGALLHPGPKSPVMPSTDGTSPGPPQDIPQPAEATLPRDMECPTGMALTVAPKDEGAGNIMPLWILTCCQPYGDVKSPAQPVKSDAPAPPQRELSSKPDADTPLPPEAVAVITPEDTPFPPEFKPPLAPTDSVVPPKPEPHIKPDAVMPVPNKPSSEVTPGDDTPLQPEPKPHLALDQGNHVIKPIPREPPKHSNLAVIVPDDNPDITEPMADIEAPLLGPPREVPDHGISGLDIIKAIVYGGLLESIASLSVISSAAGGDATTLNIVSLGLANVFGGLIVLFHNLRVLKHEHTTQHYADQLGKRGHFLLLATVAVISYLVFGMMPPLVYGFSFRQSDDKNRKIVTLAAASLVCILILSTGKAYIRVSPKKYLKTIFHYVSAGFMVSGLGYVSGELINDLLKKLGIFDSRSPVTMPIRGAGVLEGFSSY